MEFPLRVAGPWLAAHPRALGLSYSYTLFSATKPAGLLGAEIRSGDDSQLIVSPVPAGMAGSLLCL